MRSRGADLVSGKASVASPMAKAKWMNRAWVTTLAKNETPVAWASMPGMREAM